MSTSEEMVCISISVPRRVVEGVTSIAHDEDRSRSKVIARALGDWLARQAEERTKSNDAAAGHLREHRRLSGIPEESKS